jgi:hypothetical protein
MKKSPRLSTGAMIGRTSGRLDHATPGLDEGCGRELRQPMPKARAHLAQHLRIRRRIQDALALEGRFAIERPARGCREGMEEFPPDGDPHRLLARMAGRYFRPSRKLAGTIEWMDACPCATV